MIINKLKKRRNRKAKNAAKKRSLKHKFREKFPNMVSSSLNIVELRELRLSEKRSVMEIRIGKYLARTGRLFVREWVHDTLVNPRTEYPLFLDFYLPDISVAIEYNGKQHYVDDDSEKLKSQIARDKLKADWCRKWEFGYW